MEKETGLFSIDDILSASFGESSSKIRATFKKTVLVKPYETEAVELETVLDVDQPLTGAERMLLSAMLQIQLEYTAYTSLVIKKQILQSAFEARRDSLMAEFNILKAKAEDILGKNLDYLISLNK